MCVVTVFLSEDFPGLRGMGCCFKQAALARDPRGARIQQQLYTLAPTSGMLLQAVTAQLIDSMAAVRGEHKQGGTLCHVACHGKEQTPAPCIKMYFSCMYKTFYVQKIYVQEIYVLKI